MRAILALVVLSTVALTAESGAITGYISDNKCALSGAKAKTAAEWIKPAAFEKCVKDTFDAASVEKITPYLGRKVTVSGKVAGGMLKVDSVKVLKLQ